MEAVMTEPFTIAELTKRHNEYRRKWHGQRLGQQFYNTLSTHWPDLAAQVHDTPNDPFYLDEHIPGFFKWLAKKEGQ